jgi:Mannosyltransferase putative
MTNCLNAHVDMSPQQMIDLMATCPPGPWPDGWGHWKNTVAAHQLLAEEFVSQLRPSRETYAQERGIVIAGGGLKYFPSVWVNIRLLRHFGCKLPVQLWYLGDGEVDPYMKRLLEPYDVECIDARSLEAEYPCRILCGWELKLYATLHSPFAQVLFLDADNGVVCDPTYLFDTPEYKQHGAVFWPDYACWTLKPGVWKVFGMPDMADPDVAANERAFESGQYLIDKRRCDRELRLGLWYAEHSDFTFQHVYGDKECFHLAWRKLNTQYALPQAGPGWNTHTIVQYDFHGQIVFQHRCQDKWRFGGNRFVESLANEKLCFELVRELASKWSGTLWRNDSPTEAEQATIDSLVGRRALYRRVGFDERFIRFDCERLIGEGSAECERLWHVNELDGEAVLTISRLDRPTCHLRREQEGVWRGTWLEHEKMPVELITLADRE